MPRQLFEQTKKPLANQKLTSKEISNMILSGGRKFLCTLKQKALRRNNAWYSVLTFEKRRFIEAVIETVDKIRSSLLLKILTSITQKLLGAIGGVRTLIGEVSYGILNYGFPLAQKISKIGQSWGNNSAKNWASDKGFVKYLTIINLNNIPICKTSGRTSNFP